MNLKEVHITEVVVEGHSTLPADIMAASLIQSGKTGAYGDFVLVIKGLLQQQPIIILHSSALAAVPYYYTVFDNKLYSAPNVFDVCNQAAMRWEWDEFSLFCLSNIEHCVNDFTIHKKIKRFPANTTMVFFNGVLSQYGHGDCLLHPNKGNVSPNDCINVLENITADYLSGYGKCLLSLSAGMDSRVLLAACLHHGYKPIIATMGFEHSTDVKVAKQIAADCKLDFTLVQLEEKEYNSDETIHSIIRLTSGSKSMRHWHTYHFINTLRQSSADFHMAGSNGELVRSYYFDKGIFSLLFGSSFLFKKFWSLKIDKGINYGAGSFITGENKAKLLDYILSDAATMPFHDRFNHFYSKQRVRHFIGNGIAMYQSVLPVKLPFLDERFISKAAALPQQYKFNSYLHKKAIQKFYPKLLNYPTDELSRGINDFNRTFYFLKKQKTIEYNINEKIVQADFMKEIIFESKHLDNWISKADRAVIWQSKNIWRIMFLASLHHTTNFISCNIDY